MSIRRTGWLWLCCAVLLPGSAQQNGAARQSQRAESAATGGTDRRITLDVVVTDKSGRPFPGLQRQDFTLLDNKQPREIVAFRAATGRAAADDPSVEVMLLVDEVNTSFVNVGFERDQIERFLRRDGGELARPVSLVFLTDSGATIEDGPSRDGNALAASFHRKESSLRRINRSQGFYGAADRQQLCLSAIEQLADHEATVPGRKLLVWISPGWPYLTGPDVQLSAKDQQWIFSTIVGLSDALRRARITLYDVDPLGMTDAGGWRTSYYKEFVKGVRTATQAANANLALQVLAYQSGGRVLNSNNDIAGEIGTCVKEADAFYVLSFDRLAGDGHQDYHALEIKIDKPGLAARARSGYYALPQ